MKRLCHADPPVSVSVSVSVRKPGHLLTALLSIGLVLSVGFLSAGCSSGAESSSDESSSDESSSDESSVTGTAAAGQVYEIVSDAEVAAGFARVKTFAASASAQTASSDKESAQATVTSLYAAWYAFEGTVRKVDQSRYLDMEDALASLKSAADSTDKTMATKAVANFASLADSYLTAHPTGSSDVADTAAAAASGPSTAADIQLTDYSVLAPGKLHPGTYEFTLDNAGKLAHELVVFRTDLAPAEMPLGSDGLVDEKGKGVTFIDEKEDIKPSTTATLRVELPAGRYLFACNIAGHFAKKMYKVIEVK